MIDDQTRAGIAARHAGVTRLRRLTRVTALGTAVLAALLSAVAARSTPGHKQVKVTTAPAAAQPTAAVATKVPPPPALPGDSSAASASTPLAQSPAPTPVQQQPVVVSGGS